MGINKRIALLTALMIALIGMRLSHTAAQGNEPGDPIPWPGNYNHIATIPTVGDPIGVYTQEFGASDAPNVPVDPATLPNRPFLGTEPYSEDTDPANAQEASWFEQLGLDFVRVEVDASDVIDPGRTDSLLPADFTTWAAADFEQRQGWHFNDPISSVTGILQNSYGVQFPLMMLMHYGAEPFMGQIPDSDSYADYFLATVYYYNVMRGMNIKYWEVLNEPDWGYGDPAQVA